MPAKADIVNDVIRIECSPELNYLLVETTNINGWLPLNSFKNPFIRKSIKEKYNLISLDETLFNFSPDYSRQEGKEYKTQCTLNFTKDNKDPQAKESDLRNLNVTIKGYVENPNPNGMGGGNRTFTLTIKDNNQTYVDKLIFLSSDREESSLTSLRIVPHEQYIDLTGKNVKSFFFSDTIPLNMNKTYCAKTEYHAFCNLRKQ